MKKEKWLLNEINIWEAESLISPETSAALKARYTPKGALNMLAAVFSVIGALLIGAGIILILARNWDDLPIFLRVILAFLPLITSQSLALFVVKRKLDSVAWREAVAILVTASVFAAIAIVGQVFHQSSDYAVYVLTCGILSLPMIYILDAAAPLIIYYWTILNWAALEQNPVNALILLALFLAGACFVFMKKEQVNARVQYLTWITLLAGFVTALIMANMLDSSLLLILLCYFTFLLAAGELPASMQAPFNVIGLSGSLITAAILTYAGMWEYSRERMSLGGTLLAGGLAGGAVFFAIRTYKRDKLKFLFLLSLVLICAARYLWAIHELYNIWPFAFVLMILANIVFLSIGVGFIVHGVRHLRLQTTNIGMITVCSLVVMRFFDSDMDFLWRGIVFLILGIAFLLVNLKILRIRKRPRADGEV